MENPTYDEAVYMAKIKRQRAKVALNHIVASNSVFGRDQDYPPPGMEVLLDYFMNMVYGLELVLKVLAKDWDTGKSKYRHAVGEMYKAVFGRPHADPTFMGELEAAILDQKYIYEPACGLLNRVEAMETLWDELKHEYQKGAWGKISTVKKDVEADETFGKYLLGNVARFTKLPTHRSDPMTTGQKIQMRRMQIEGLQQEITRLETEGEPELTGPEICAQLDEQFRTEVERRQDMMRRVFQMRGTSKLSFMVWTSGVA